MEVILTQMRCTVTYHSFSDDRLKVFAIAPLHLFVRDGGLYVLVQSIKYGSILKLAVERIASLEKDFIHFEYPSDFDVNRYLESHFDIFSGESVTFRIWVAPEQSRYILERKWAADQHIEKKSDGSLILTITTSGWPDVKRWLLSWGSGIVLLEPENYRNELEAELKTMLDNY